MSWRRVTPVRISEERHQQTVVEWAAMSRRRYMLDDVTSALDFLYAVPNGGHRNKATAGKLKAQGVKRGVPDLVLPVPSGEYPGLYLEMKTAGGDTTSEQRWWLHYLARMGYRTDVAFNGQEGCEVLVRYLEFGVRPLAPVPA